MQISSIAFSLFLFACVDIVQSGRDFYKILGVPRNAKKDQIKSAYRLKAKEFHPDLNKDNPKAKEIFQDVSNAYEVLKDDKKRRIYDKSGEEGLRNDGGGDPFKASGFSNIFGSFFNFGGDNDDQRDSGPVRGGDVEMNLYVTLEELYNGDVIEMIRVKPSKEAARGTRKCNCRMEVRTVQTGPGRFQMIQEQVCDECPNYKYVPKESVLEIDILPGFPDNHIIYVDGEGEPHVDGENGDLKLKVNVVRHKTFERKGDDLYTNMTITLLDALLGFETEIAHLDKQKVRVVKTGKTTSPGEIMKIPNKGMPRFRSSGSYYGDLYITFSINMPRFIDQSVGEELRKILGQESQQFTKNML
ncbi:hypothetical protein ACOME3_005632 [Neoechinorhynchus agilis]